VQKNKVIVVIVFVIISFFIFRHCVNVGASVVGTISSSVLYPLLRIQQLIVVPIAGWFDRRTTVAGLEGHVQRLQEENEKLFAENIALKAMHDYAQETSELRNFNKRYTLRNGYIAQILARHFSSSYQFFLVDAGSCQGIKKDMVALYCNNIVGRVAEVYPWYCKVCLITDADCKVASSVAKTPADTLTKKGLTAIALAKVGASGIHEGVNDTTRTIMRYVSHLESVDVGDAVLSSGEGLVFPKGFALGKVVAADKGELFYTITIKPILDFNTLRYCTLISKEDVA